MLDDLLLWFLSPSAWPRFFGWALAVVLAAAVGFFVGYGAISVLRRNDRVAGRYEFSVLESRFVGVVTGLAFPPAVASQFYLFFVNPYVDWLVHLLASAGFFLTVGFLAGVLRVQMFKCSRTVGTFLPSHKRAREIRILVKQEGPLLWSLHIKSRWDVELGLCHRLCARLHLFGFEGWRRLVHSKVDQRQFVLNLIEIAVDLVREAERNGERGYSLILASALLPGRETMFEALREKLNTYPTEDWDVQPVKRTLSRLQLVVGKSAYGWKIRSGRARILAEGAQIWHRSRPRPWPVRDSCRDQT